MRGNGEGSKKEEELREEGSRKVRGRKVRWEEGEAGIPGRERVGYLVYIIRLIFLSV